MHGLRGWRPLNGRPGLRMTVSRRSKSRGRGPSLYARLVCDINSALEMVSGRCAIKIHLLTCLLPR